MATIKYDDVSIYYDSQRNRYAAKVTLEKGKERINVRGKTEEEVLLKARQLLYGARDEHFIVTKGIPLIELVKLNFERRDNAGQFGNAQYNRTLYIIKQIENSNIALKNVRDITERDYQEFFNELASKYADSTIDKCYAEINQALKYAKKKKIIDEIKLEDMIKPKSKKLKKEVIPLTVEQQKILSDYLFSKTMDEYKYKNVFLIQMYMGLRIGEVLTLKRKDIDLKKRTIHIERTLTENRERKKSCWRSSKNRFWK